MSLARPPRPDADDAVKIRNPVTWAIQIGAVVVLCGFGSALYLARQFQAAPRSVDMARLPDSDPETTGSIDVRAKTGHLDPCAVARGSSFR